MIWCGSTFGTDFGTSEIASPVYWHGKNTWPVTSGRQTLDASYSEGRQAPFRAVDMTGRF